MFTIIMDKTKRTNNKENNKQSLVDMKQEKNMIITKQDKNKIQEKMTRRKQNYYYDDKTKQ